MPTLIDILTRDEHPADRESIRAVNEAAFGRPDEAGLIDRLRSEGATLLSLVAERNAQIVGHILFSRMYIDTPRESIAAVSLAPMAVLPKHQRREVGSDLVRRGIAELRTRGERIVLVLGHEHYYPRFGFSTRMARNLKSPFPPEAFMALELVDGSLSGVHGVVRYPAAFGL